jgi:hypothetical protein
VPSANCGTTIHRQLFANPNYLPPPHSKDWMHTAKHQLYATNVYATNPTTNVGASATMD